MQTTKYMNLPSSRVDALKIGSKRYFTGKPCPQGHVAYRRTINYGCSACLSKNSLSWISKNRARYNLSVRRSWEKNADKYNKKRREFNAENKAEMLVSLARQRARKKGIEFSITADSLYLPTHCPALGIEIDYAIAGGWKTNSPTLDRVDNSRGYVPGNVFVISFRANAIKSDASLSDLEKIISYVRSAKKCGV